MKKPTIILGKKHIIIASLSLVLGIAVYLNYLSSETGFDMSLLKSDDINEVANYGDAEFVDSSDSENYFAKARIERTQKRDEAAMTLQTMLSGGDLTDEEIATMKLDAVETSKLVESESVVESLIKAQGFEDCVVYLDGESASIVVKSDGLESSEAAQIKNILLGEISVPAENITIFEVK